MAKIYIRHIASGQKMPLLEKSLVKINSQKKSESFCFDTSFTGEGGTSLAGWLSVGDARKVDWSHERHVEADRAIGVMH